MCHLIPNTFFVLKVRYVSSSKVIFDLSSAELTSYISLKAKVYRKDHHSLISFFVIQLTIFILQMVYVGAFSTVKARVISALS